MPRIPISPYLIIQKTSKNLYKRGIKGEHALLLERDKNITDTLPFLSMNLYKMRFLIILSQKWWSPMAIFGVLSKAKSWLKPAPSIQSGLRVRPVRLGRDHALLQKTSRDDGHTIRDAVGLNKHRRNHVIWSSRNWDITITRITLKLWGYTTAS